MRVPISWLKEYVDVTLSVQEVDDLLTNAGLEVKGVERYGVAGADLEWDAEKILLGQILTVKQHPNADRLVLAEIDYGADEPETVVTGAPNLFQFLEQGDVRELNLYSPIALEGATLYDGHKEEPKLTTLKGRELRGIYNKSMLCSEKELGMSEEHEGIILIYKGAQSPDYQAGAPLVDVLGDVVLEIDIIPNIARCASILGVAREYAALTNQPLREPSYDLVTEGKAGKHPVTIHTEEPELNPRFVGIVIEGVSQSASPYWMQHRLKMAGQRPINIVVDISNYVMLEMGQPNHTFDYDFLRQRADGPVQLITRLPHEGETLKTLDGKEHKLGESHILVTDPQGNLSLGGIMGGFDSEIQPETTNVLLEAAAWNFINIRKTSTSLGIFTEASFRFSRGVHPSQAMLGAKRAAELLRVLAGGTVSPDIVDYYPLPSEPVIVELPVTYVRRLSGLDVTAVDIRNYLQRLAFTVETINEETLRVTVPDHRMDIEGPHDLVEEVCRVVGYANIPMTVLADTLPPQRGNDALEGEEHVKDILVMQGLSELITYRPTSVEYEQKLYVGAGDQRPYVTITNPSSEERGVMRHSLLGAALEVAARNSRFLSRVSIFEIGPVYLVNPDAVLPDEQQKLAIVLSGQRQEQNWQDSAPPLYDFYDLKGVLENLFAKLHVDVTFEGVEHETYRPGRSAKLLLGKQEIGLMGEIHPLVIEALDMQVEAQQAVLGAELDVTALVNAIPVAYDFDPISSYPAVHEDIAILVDASIPAETVAQKIQDAGGFFLQKVELFDLYEGKQVPEGQKSLAYHLTFQSPHKTLKDKDVSKSRKRIIGTLAKQLGAKLRD